MECYCFLRNIQDLMSDGKTPCERRFGMLFYGPVIPFVAIVKYHPISAKDISRSHQFGPTVLPGIFFGFVLYAGGIWKGDIMIADIEEWEEMDASEIHARRLNAKEVLMPMKGGRRWNSQNQWRRSTSETIHLGPGSSRTRRGTRSSSSESDGLSSPTPLQDDSTRDDAEAQNDFWSITGDFISRHHVNRTHSLVTFSRVSQHTFQCPTWHRLKMFVRITSCHHAREWLFWYLFDSPLCTLHRLSHLPLHSPDLHLYLHLLCGLVRGEVPCALPRMRS